ncbi:MAG: hypothetical protein HYV97_05910, partial [Bdellovibrio sp.]|nr:hypothetical protein [Bdellovibrio sp.]
MRIQSLCGFSLFFCLFMSCQKNTSFQNEKLSSGALMTSNGQETSTSLLSDEMKTKFHALFKQNMDSDIHLATRVAQMSELAKIEAKKGTLTQGRIESWKAEIEEGVRRAKNRNLANVLSKTKFGLKELETALVQKTNFDEALAKVDGVVVDRSLNKIFLAPLSKHIPKKVPESFLGRLNGKIKLEKLQSTANTQTCTSIPTVDPDPSGDSLTASDLFTERTSNVLSIANQLGTAEKIFWYVKEEVKWQANFGATQTSEQLLYSKQGTSLDKSALLVALFRAKNISAQIMLGEILMRKEDLKGLYGVEGDLDLFWAHWGRVGWYFKNAQGNLDSSLMLQRLNNEVLWIVPHAWVRAYIDNQWITLDPTGPFVKVLPTLPSQQRAPIQFNFTNWLTAPDEQGRYVKPGNIFDRIFKDLRMQIGDDRDIAEFGVQLQENQTPRDSDDLITGTIGIDEPCVKMQSDIVPNNYSHNILLKIKNLSDGLIFQYNVPTAQVADKPLYLAHSKGLYGETGTNTGSLLLYIGTDVFRTYPISSNQNLKVYAAHEYPPAIYKGNIYPKEEKPGSVDNILAGGVQVFVAGNGPTTVERFTRKVERLKTLQSGTYANQVLMAHYLDLAGTFFLLKETQKRKDHSVLFGYDPTYNDLLRLYTSIGKILDRQDRFLSKSVIDVNIDATINSGAFQRTGNKLTYLDYPLNNDIRNLDLIVGSASEHQIWDEVFGIPGGSAVFVLQETAKRGLPFLVDKQLGINPTDPDDTQIFGLLGPDMRHIENFIKENNWSKEKGILYAPKNQLTIDNGWKGVGYFVFPSTPFGGGIAAFATVIPGINSKGGSTLGANVDLWEYLFGDNFNSFGESSCNPVNFSSGEMYHDFVDFNLKGRTSNTSLTFKRRYFTNLVNSSGDFGSGWSHSYDARLISPTGDFVNTGTNLGTLNPASTGDIVFINEDGGEVLYKRKTGNTFEGPKSDFNTLVEFTDHYEIHMKGGAVWEFARLGANPPGKLQRIIDPHGEQITLKYNNGRLRQVLSPLAGSLLFNRDVQGRIIEVINERDNLSMSYGYNPQGRLETSTTNFDNKSWSYTYESRPGTKADGLLTSMTDPLMRTISFVYFDNGKVFQEIGLGGAKQQYFYSHYLIDRATRVVGPNGEETEYRLDDKFNIVETVYHDRARRLTNFDEKRLLTSEVDELGYKAEHTYDLRGNRTGTKRAEDSTFSQIVYDQMFDVPTSITPREGLPTTFIVNPINGDITRQARGTLYLDFTRDAFGNLLQTTNNRASYTNLTNNDGQLTQVFDARNPETREYDERNRLKKRTFASGRIIEMTFDDYDRVL